MEKFDRKSDHNFKGMTFLPWLPQRKLDPFNRYLWKKEIKQSDWRTFSIIFTFTDELSKFVLTSF